MKTPKNKLSLGLAGLGLAICLHSTLPAFADPAPLPSGCVAWWKAENNFLDSVGTNHGMALGTMGFGAGKVAQAFTPGGAGSGVLLGNPANLQLQTLTIEGWVKRSNPSRASFENVGGAEFVAYGSGGYAFGVADNGTLFLSKAPGGSVDSHLAITDTNYHHVALTKSGSAVVYYIDGIADPAGDFVESFSFTTPVAIGTWAEGSTATFMGQIDELAIYNRALRADEIAAIHAAGSAGKAAPTSATLTWTGSVNTDWHTAGNWSPAQVPTSADTVIINSGTVYTTTDSRFGVLNWVNGVVRGPLVVAGGGVLNWAEGELQGWLLVESNGVMNLSGNGAKYCYGSWTNSGIVRLRDIGAILWNGGVANRAGALWEFETDSSLAWYSGTETFLNEGTVRKSGGTGLSNFQPILTNLGLVEVQSGTLNFDKGGGRLDGTFSAASGTEVRFAGGAFTSSAPPHFAGLGQYRFTGGSFQLHAVIPNLQMTAGTVTLAPDFQGGAITNLTISGPGLVNTLPITGQLTLDGWSWLSGSNLVAGVLNFSDGLMQGPVVVAGGGVLNWLGGELQGWLRVESNGLVNLSGSGAKYCYGSWTNSGTVRLRDYGVVLWNGGVVNRAGALWEFESDSSLEWFNRTETFLNEGTVRKSGGTGPSNFQPTLTNLGLVEVQSGAFNFNGGSFEMSHGLLRFGFSNTNDFGQVHATVPVTLGGGIGAEFLNGFVPPPGMNFTVMTFPSRLGAFSNANTPFYVSADRGFQPSLTTTNLQLLTLTTNLGMLPAILAQPQSLTNLAGTTATFSVVATGTAPLAYQWRFNSANVPNGGRISGAATATLSVTNILLSDAGSYTVVVTNAYGAITSQVAGLTVLLPLEVSTGSFPVGTVGTAYSQTLAATGGLAPYTWAIVSGSLPAGLSLSTAGSISGTPTTNVTASFTVQVKDTLKTTATRALSLTVNPTALVVSTTTLPAGTVGTVYNHSLAATGGVTPYTWTVVAGALPTGLSLSSAGVISGTPTTNITASFTVQAKDASNTTATKPLSLIVNPTALAVATTTLPSATVGVAYNQNLTATGGVLPYSWSVVSGSLPAGLTLGGGGTLSGTPTSHGTNSFRVQVRDAKNVTAQRDLPLIILPAALSITTVSLPPGRVGLPYNQPLSASGGVLPYTWSLVSGGSLPAGLTLNSSGSISGTPTTAGNSAFRVQVAATGVSPVQKDLELVVTNPVTGSLTFAMGSATNLQGAEVVIPVVTSEFRNVTVFQFSTHWNPAVAQFIALEQLGLPGLAAGSFGTNQVANGTATISWDDPDGLSKTLTNGAVVFALRLKLIGAPGATSVLTIDGTPTAIEAVDEQLSPLTVATVAGTLKILDRISIGGTIRYYDPAKTVPGAAVTLSGAGQQSANSDTAGTYFIGEVAVGGNYTLTPTRLTDNPIGQGVTSSDILLIRRQILGIAALDSPHKLLAADVNGSSTVSTVDITYLRRFILGSTNTLPAGLWRFVPSDYTFPNPASPWTAPKARSYAGLTMDQTGQDFVAVKLGDVNNSWMWSGTMAPNPVAKGDNGPKSNGHVTFAASSGNCTAGEEVVIPITVYGFTNVTSAQFTLQWDAAVLEYVGVSAFGLADLTAGNFGTNHINTGKLTLAWDDPTLAGVSVTNGAAIFTLTVRARTGLGGLSSVTFVDDPTVREVTVNSEVVEFASVAGQIAVAASTSPPELALRMEGGKPVLTITAAPGTRVEIQRVGALTGTEWAKLDEVVVDSASQDWTDQSASSSVSWFYRVKVLP